MSFPRYPAYKDSGVEWLGEVPADWSVLPAKYGISSKSGGQTTKNTVSPEPVDGLYPAFSASGQDIWMDEFEFEGPALVLSAVGARCGKTFKADGRWGVVANTHCLFPRKDFNREFLWYLTNREGWWERGGTAQPFVKVSETLARKWVFPTAREQELIAQFLERETAKIDALVAEQEQLITLLKEKRQAVISHAVTKGLDPSVPMKDSGVEWLGEVPAHWAVGKCGFYIRILSGFAFPSSGFSRDEANHRLLRGANVGVSRLKWDDTVFWERSEADGLDEYEMSEGDLVIGMDRPLISEGMRVAKVTAEDLPSLLLQRVASLKVGPKLHADYLHHLLSSDMFIAHFSPETTGVSVPHISSDQINDFVIPVPPIDEQRAIVEHLSNLTTSYSGLINEAVLSIELLRERRSALISAAVTGQIDVRGLATAKEAA